MRTLGYLCQPDRLVPDDARSLRRHFRSLVQAGLLPGDWSYRALTRRIPPAAMAIEVVATSPRPIYAVDPLQPGETRHPQTGELAVTDTDRLTVEAKAVDRALVDLRDGHNWVDVDGAAVKFQGGVTVRTVDGMPDYVPAGHLGERLA